MDDIKKENHNVFPARGAASPISTYIPAPSIMPIPDNVTSKSPKLRFKDLISSPPVKITGFNISY